MLNRLAKAVLPNQVRARLSWAKQVLAHRTADRKETKQQAASWDQVRQTLPTSEDPGAWYQAAQQEFGIAQAASEVCALITRLRHDSPTIAGEIGTRDGGNSFLFMHAVPSIKHYLGMDLQVRIGVIVNRGGG
jgi:hypothetical protein